MNKNKLLFLFYFIHVSFNMRHAIPFVQPVHKAISDRLQNQHPLRMKRDQGIQTPIHHGQVPLQPFKMNRNPIPRVGSFNKLNQFAYPTNMHYLRLKNGNQDEIQNIIEDRLHIRLKEQAMDLYRTKFKKYVEKNSTVWNGVIKYSRAYSFFLKVFHDIELVLKNDKNPPKTPLMNHFIIFEKNFSFYLSVLTIINDESFDYKLLVSKQVQYIRTSFKAYYDLLGSLKNLKLHVNDNFLLDLNRLIIEFEIDTIFRSDFILQLAIVSKTKYVEKKMKVISKYDRLVKDFISRMNLFKSYDTAITSKFRYSIIIEFYIKFYNMFVVNIKSIQISENLLQSLISMENYAEILLTNCKKEKKQIGSQQYYYYQYQKSDFLDFQYMVITIHQKLSSKNVKFYYKNYIEKLFDQLIKDLKKFEFFLEKNYILEQVNHSADFDMQDVIQMTFDFKLIASIEHLLKVVSIKQSIFLQQVWTIISLLYRRKDVFQNKSIIVSSWVTISNYYILILQFIKLNKGLTQQNDRIIYKQKHIQYMKQALDDLYAQILLFKFDDDSGNILIKQIKIILISIEKFKVTELKIQDGKTENDFIDEKLIYEDIIDQNNYIKKDQKVLRIKNKKINQDQLVQIIQDNTVLIQILNQYNFLYALKRIEKFRKLYEIIEIYQMKYLDQTSKYQNMDVQLLIQQILLLIIEFTYNLEQQQNRLQIDKQIILFLFQSTKIEQNFSDIGELYIKLNDFNKDLDQIIIQQEDNKEIFLELIEDDNQDLFLDLKNGKNDLKKNIQNISKLISQQVFAQIRIKDDDDEEKVLDQIVDSNQDPKLDQLVIDKQDSSFNDKQKMMDDIKNKIKQNFQSKVTKVKVRKIYVIEILDCEDCLQ